MISVSRAQNPGEKAALNADMPKNAKLISQSCTQNDLLISLIDTDNNELVIIRYGLKVIKFVSRYELVQVMRTGIKIDPTTQGYIKGSDFPAKDEKEDKKSDDN